MGLTHVNNLTNVSATQYYWCVRRVSVIKQS